MARSIVGLFVALALAGCANNNAIFQPFRPDNGQSVSIDAKQRVVFAINKDPGGREPWTAICAEPSPDALSALSASLALDAAGATRALGLAYATQEGAASIGLRTQTITILRDAMYRLCEGYASGALDEIGFARLQRRYQNIMLGLLSIEQLTGAIVANQAALGGSASAKLGQSLAQITVMIDEARGREITAKTSVETTQAKLKTATEAQKAAEENYQKVLKAADGKEDADPVKAAKTDLEGKNKDASTAKSNNEKAVVEKAKASAELDDLQSIRKELDRAGALASATSAFSSPGRSGPVIDAVSMEKIANSVTEIVNKLVTHDYTKETCLDTIMSRSYRAIAKEPDALELAIRYCAYALEAEALASPAAEASRAVKLTASRTAFTNAVEEVFKARREVSKKAAEDAQKK